MAFSQVLETELEALNQMCHLLEEERDILLEGNPASIVAFVERKQSLYRHLQRCEEQRKLVMGTLSWKEVLQQHPELEPKINEMKRALQVLQQLSRESEAWNQIAKHYKEKEIQLLTKWLGTKDSVYQKCGKYDSRPSGALIKRQF